MAKGAKPGSNNGGGRRPGTPNRVTIEQIERIRKAVEAGQTPLEYLLSVMRAPVPRKLDDESATEYGLRLTVHENRCMEAAKSAAPYVHPRLQTTEVKVPEPVRVEMDLVEVAKRIAYVLSTAAQA